ncbi:MAG: bifunctional DNA primase/polymerase [Brevundimonas sp.]|uniref:bifunctional DNA primase/polymerase n=1 Tax=Brevundimonas sp. TaxID=1871086 RepID=UPI0040331A0E
MTTPMMEAAVRLAGLGIAVFPLRPRMKTPYGRTSWKVTASRDPDLAQERWSGRAYLPLKPIEELREKNPGKSDEWLLRPVAAGPSANVAIATGAPAGFWVLDEDGPDAAAWVAAREAENSPLPETVEQQTARGRHRCFAWCEAAQAAGLGNRSGLSKAPVDVRGEGGYIVVAPSIHPGDAKKGIAPGWVYRWLPGHAPWEMDFAPAPAWLIDLVKPREPKEADVTPKRAEPRVRVQGRASAYGEAALDRACATIISARVGSRDTTLYAEACSIGQLVAGGEIDEAYAVSALKAAGEVHVPSMGTSAQVARQVERAMDWGATRPRSPAGRDGGSPRRVSDDNRLREPVRVVARPVTGTATDAAGLWAEGQSADVGMVRAWLKLRQLAHQGPWATFALARCRAHADAPLSDHGHRGPGLLVRLDLPGEVEGPPSALGVIPLAGGPKNLGAERFTHFVGDPAGRAWVVPGGDGSSVLVAIDMQDAWALAADLAETDDMMTVAVTPTLSAFCGGAMGDAYGRINPTTPAADPERPPWMMTGMASVFLAVRGDLTPPEVRARKFAGGTQRVELTGEAAADFCGALAEQAWRRPVENRGGGANRIRILRPHAGAGFHSKRISG